MLHPTKGRGNILNLSMVDYTMLDWLVLNWLSSTVIVDIKAQVLYMSGTYRKGR